MTQTDISSARLQRPKHTPGTPLEDSDSEDEVDFNENDLSLVRTYVASYISAMCVISHQLMCLSDCNPLWVAGQLPRPQQPGGKLVSGTGCRAENHRLLLLDKARRGPDIGVPVSERNNPLGGTDSQPDLLVTRERGFKLSIGIV